ncbi:MAG: hypothetical protein SVK08_00565 [Halobacteriota archaeon]|nr:hypothetical protein [Halobacteriota archaeon]
MNCYGDLTTLKSRFDITGTSGDSDLLALLNAASRAIELPPAGCDRYFYARTQTRYFDGAGSTLYIDDLLSVTTLKTDEDGDGTYENTFAATDYLLYPLNGFPYTRIKLSHDSDYGSFAAGIKKGVEIAGLWGYGDGTTATPYTDSGVTVTVNTTTGTTITVSADDTIKPGHTILAGSEQMYCSAVGTGSFTATRAVNGTTASTHSTATAYIYDYPLDIIEACYIQSMRWRKRAESAFQDAVGSPEVGQLMVYKGLDADVAAIIARYKKRNF